MSSVEVKILKNFGREAWLRQKWNRLWAEIGERIQMLPKRQQEILLEDFHTAIKSRLIIMERINDAKRNS